MYKRIIASGDLVMPKGTRIYAVRLESTSDDCYAIIYDAVTAALGATNSNQICTLFVTNVVGDGDTGTGIQDIHPNSDKQSFGPIGITTERGISITLNGTTPKCYIYYS